MTKAENQVTEFADKVYQACSKIPKGKVTTYKLLAISIGDPNASRAVGSALKRNPYAPKVPCHRVISSNLTIGGFSGSADPDGPEIKKKRELLLSEGVIFESGSKRASPASLYDYKY